MCTRYITPQQLELENFWKIDRRSNDVWPRQLFPLSRGPFVRRKSSGVDDGTELVVGQWGMIPQDSETFVPKSTPRGPGDKAKPISTVNARAETVASRPTYRDAWKRGQRCVIPAESFDEPFWGPYEAQFKRCEWWRFQRADGAPWGVAGLWSEWTDPATGVLLPNFTMVTVNADDHPLMNRMHKWDLKKPKDEQDKRSLVLLDARDFDQWLAGTVEEARALIKLTPVEMFAAGPVSDDPSRTAEETLL